MPNLAELTTTAVSQAAQPIAEPTKTYRWVFTADGRWEISPRSTATLTCPRAVRTSRTFFMAGSAPDRSIAAPPQTTPGRLLN